MDEPRAKPEDAVAVALANLDRRITDAVENLDARCNERFERLAVELRALDRLSEEKFVKHKTMLEAQAEKVALALAASDKAISKSETSSDERFRSHNNLIAQMKERDAEYARADDLKRVEEQIVRIGSRLDTMPEIRALASRADMDAGASLSTHRLIPYALTIFGLVLTVAFLYLALRKG